MSLRELAQVIDDSRQQSGEAQSLGPHLTIGIAEALMRVLPKPIDENLVYVYREPPPVRHSVASITVEIGMESGECPPLP